jgi:hypothetical protein
MSVDSRWHSSASALRSAEALKRGRGEFPSWVCCSEAGTPLDLSNVTKGWRQVLKHAKLPGFRLYERRRATAARLTMP